MKIFQQNHKKTYAIMLMMLLIQRLLIIPSLILVVSTILPSCYGFAPTTNHHAMIQGSKIHSFDPIRKVLPPVSVLQQKRTIPHFKSELYSVEVNDPTDNVMTTNENGLIGDDSAAFSLEEQNLNDWIKFSTATGTVLAFVAYMWFLPFGPHLGDAFLTTIQSFIGTTSPDVTIFAMLSFFAVCHSGLAGLRPYAEEIVGARAWRVVFALVSLPLALSCISYFVNHCHEGIQLWDLTKTVPGLHTLCWITDFISFLFLYPSTFNLLEIAAIEKPQLHLWETGVIRITRHPQAMGQIMWCVAHSVWLGSSTAVSASAVLILHHLYSVWHGDRRLERKHGEAFEIMKERTSVIPFQAIIEGRQELPEDYYKEFLRGPYALVVGGTVAAYFAHPWMMAGAALLKW